jgi:hypothetical protein
MEYNKNRTQVFITAPSKEELIKRMLLVTTLNMKSYNFYPPMKDGKEWVVWYYADIMRDSTWDQKPLITLLGEDDEQ